MNEDGIYVKEIAIVSSNMYAMFHLTSSKVNEHDCLGILEYPDVIHIEQRYYLHLKYNIINNGLERLLKPFISMIPCLIFQLQSSLPGSSDTFKSV